MKEKKENDITLVVKNKQLDALEDLLFLKLTQHKKEKCLKQVKTLWTNLVNEYDKKKKR